MYAISFRNHRVQQFPRVKRWKPCHRSSGVAGFGSYRFREHFLVLPERRQHFGSARERCPLVFQAFLLRP